MSAPPRPGTRPRARRDLRRPATLAVTAVLGAVPATMALTSAHLAAAPALLVTSTVTATLAVAAMAVGPWGAALHPRGPRRRPWGHVHVLLGVAALALVVVHVVALLVLAPDDALFAMSFDGPTRARMALMSLVLLVVVVLLGALRRRLGWRGATWRLLHGTLAVFAIALGVGHAVLTEGALDGAAGTVVLLTLGLVGVGGAATRGFRTRRRRERARSGQGKGLPV